MVAWLKRSVSASTSTSLRRSKETRRRRQNRPAVYATPSTSASASISPSPSLRKSSAKRFNPKPLRLTDYAHPLPCICNDILSIALDGALGTTSISGREPTKLTLEDLQRIIDPIERISRCDKCTKEEAYLHFFHIICNGTMEQYRLFYHALVDDFHGLEDETDTDDSTERRSNGIRPLHPTCCQYIIEGERIIACIDRFMRIVDGHDTYDYDTWYTVRNQAEQLVNATEELGTGVRFGAEMDV
ncbi:hypothetical protein BO70DRAFT_17087 [Aspergillus heteromorphus CBS 117.55]|uniref:Uncharacterized protein n=1 Tax=Aspergillus heteromorphus CBS 117.55 TaxID=1448321 RepID=A0A317X594_9EURO|nr:uncharacterized protein BO70DRAFT_17087 [Aspergillus heteromorphus CBS 117.55]PWY92707.1 hypothetical protein BO70DRAFT_17087 [Aspergillus heteromorphus CBS 117.55]